MVEGNFSPSTKNFSSPSPHQPPRGFQTWSITPQKRPRPCGLEHRPVDLARSGSSGRKASRCHLAWKRPSCSMGRRSGAKVPLRSSVRGLVPSLMNSNCRLRGEGHVPVAVVAFLGHAQREGAVEVRAGGRAEEIAERRPDAGLVLAVPRDLQHDVAQGLDLVLTVLELAADAESRDAQRPIEPSPRTGLPAQSSPSLAQLSRRPESRPERGRPWLRILLASSRAAFSSADNCRLNVGTCVPLG